jgi:hypothetical protein
MECRVTDQRYPDKTTMRACTDRHRRQWSMLAKQPVFQRFTYGPLRNTSCADLTQDSHHLQYPAALRRSFRNAPTHSSKITRKALSNDSSREVLQRSSRMKTNIDKRSK